MKLTYVLNLKGLGPAATVARATLRNNVMGAAASLAVQQGLETWRLASGAIGGREYGRRSAAHVAGTSGGLGGAAAGAALGSCILPGPGTAVGALLGGIGGSAGMRALTRKLVGG